VIKFLLLVYGIRRLTIILLSMPVLIFLWAPLWKPFGLPDYLSGKSIAA